MNGQRGMGSGDDASRRRGVAPGATVVRQDLERYRILARLLDSRFRFPGTRFRFGWDAILGLLPGAGDAAGGLLGGYGLYVAWRLGAPASVMLRLLLNLGLDLGVGTLPLLGDLFDAGWKSHQRNLALLERWLAAPHPTRRRSGALLLGLLAGLLLACAGTMYVVVRLAGWLVAGAGR